MTENWIATWGTAQQLAPAAEPGGGPQMPDDGPPDQAAADDLRDATPFRSYLWLTEIDVRAPSTAATVVALGDSLVDGMETTPDADDVFFGFLPGLPPSERATAEDIVVGHRMLIHRVRPHGLKVIGCTLLPIGSTPMFTPELERMRQDVNHWIRTSGEFDAVADLDLFE